MADRLFQGREEGKVVALVNGMESMVRPGEPANLTCSAGHFVPDGAALSLDNARFQVSHRNLSIYTLLLLRFESLNYTCLIFI